MRYNILATASSFFLIGLVLLVSPDISYAQAGGLVPCNGPECDTCDLLKLSQNVIDFFVRIIFVVSALLFAAAGFLFFTAGDDPSKITNARKIFINTFIGSIIVLTAWLVVNIIITTLTGQGINPFVKVICDVNPTSNSVKNDSVKNYSVKSSSVNNSSKEDSRVSSEDNETDIMDIVFEAQARLENRSTVETTKFDLTNNNTVDDLKSDCDIVGGTYTNTCVPHAGLECGITVHSCNGF